MCGMTNKVTPSPRAGSADDDWSLERLSLPLGGSGVDHREDRLSGADAA